MNRLIRMFSIAACVAAIATLPVSGQTVLVDGRNVSLAETRVFNEVLWVYPESVLKLTGFSLKPEGACLKDLCIPIDPETRKQLIQTTGDRKWVRLDLFLETVKQPYAMDKEDEVWSLGRRAGKLEKFESELAEDFELRDRSGKSVRLSDFRGKKVILFTWASW